MRRYPAEPWTGTMLRSHVLGREIGLKHQVFWRYRFLKMILHRHGPGCYCPDGCLKINSWEVSSLSFWQVRQIKKRFHFREGKNSVFPNYSSLFCPGFQILTHNRSRPQDGCEFFHFLLFAWSSNKKGQAASPLSQ